MGTLHAVNGIDIVCPGTVHRRDIRYFNVCECFCAVELADLQCCVGYKIAEFSDRIRLVQSHDAGGQHQLVTDGLQPFLTDRIRGYDADNGAEGCTGTVGIISQSAGNADSLGEISAGCKPGNNDQSQVDGDIRPVLHTVFGNKPFPCRIGITKLVDALHSKTDSLCQPSILRNEGESDRDEFPCSLVIGDGFTECRTLDCREEHTGFHAVCIVIVTGILPRKLYRQCRTSGSQACPQLTADCCAHSGIEFVAVKTAERCESSQCRIPTSRTVLIRTTVLHMLPQPGQMVSVDRKSEAADNLKGNYLKVQIIVGCHGCRDRCVKVNFPHGKITFKGHSQRSAHCLSDETATELFLISFEIHFESS